MLQGSTLDVGKVKLIYENKKKREREAKDKKKYQLWQLFAPLIVAIVIALSVAAFSYFDNKKYDTRIYKLEEWQQETMQTVETDEPIFVEFE